MAAATVTPSVLAHWTHYDADDYSEIGAGGANLTVHPEAMDIAELGMGMAVNWNIPNRDGSRFTPEVTAGYRYDLVGDRVETTSSHHWKGSWLLRHLCYSFRIADERETAWNSSV